MEEMKQLIDKAKKIVITTHKNPDGDAIGSSLALFHFFKNIKKNDVEVIVPDSFPDFLNWMNDADKISCYDKQKEQADKLFSDADLIFSLDYNALERVGDMAEAIKNASAIKIMIDHHQDTQGFANHYFVDTDCCSTAQLVYEFIEKLEETKNITKDVAECLYCGIMTDTGSFRYPSTTAKTHKIIAHLIDSGADNAKIHQAVFDNNTTDRLRLLGFALTNKMKVFAEKGFAYISLSQDELKQFNFKKGDTEGLVNYPLSIQGIKFSVLLTEKEKDISISFRSKEDVFVNEFAKKHFQGGGHFYASGGKSDLTLDETIAKLEKLLMC
ncbi:MAG: DHH family phosphoesterase [Bacteroidetes bacterium HGW-Bacteroidetes-12]|nr:MAG: DHH family phosphoesterase [Bacteroidetes bacterium HGW-Bacteroidetes-12]